MTNRDIARELTRRNLGALGGRNDQVELLPRVRVTLAGLNSNSAEATYLMLHARVWFDIDEGTWHFNAPPGHIDEHAATRLTQRVIDAARDALEHTLN